MGPNNIEIDVTNYPEKSENENQKGKDFVEYSNRIVDALSAKVQGHNKSKPKTVTNIKILKKVYRNAARDYETNENLSRSAWCMARVNMFLRLASGEMSELQVGQGKKSTLGKYLDISEHFVPSEGDVSASLEDLKKYNLNFDFDSVNDLYLDEYQHFGINW
jgi:hypothetical protein